MTSLPTQQQTMYEADARSVPGWVAQMLGIKPALLGPAQEHEPILVSDDGRWALARTAVGAADDFNDDTLRQAATRAYAQALKQLADASAPYPVRAWNTVPCITHCETPGRDRYMAFNAGRYAAYTRHFAGQTPLTHVMPAASAVGHDGGGLTISVLGHHRPGEAVENPRQVPAFRYSNRYGTTPPSFVRATALSGEHVKRILVAGTASVVGEASRHVGDLHKQLEETYHNLASVVATACDRSACDKVFSAHERQAWLDRYRFARVYIRSLDDFQPVIRSVSNALAKSVEIELVRADICRPELLVEIEGVAEHPINQEAS